MFDLRLCFRFYKVLLDSEFLLSSARFSSSFETITTAFSRAFSMQFVVINCSAALLDLPHQAWKQGEKLANCLPTHFRSSFPKSRIGFQERTLIALTSRMYLGSQEMKARDTAHNGGQRAESTCSWRAWSEIETERQREQTVAYEKLKGWSEETGYLFLYLKLTRGANKKEKANEEEEKFSEVLAGDS